MILSVSRRTDIPRFYMPWFLNRLREGYVLVRNPMNHAQVSRVPLGRDVVDCIVFWTKDPRPLLQHLDALADYPFYVQCTLNPYGTEVEKGLPPKEEIATAFLRLARAIGPQRMVWRYSPVLVNEGYTRAFHREAFARTANTLQGATHICRLSFLDHYAKIAPAMERLGAKKLADGEKLEMACEFLAAAQKEGMALSACGDACLVAGGIPQAHCVDEELIAQMLGAPLQLGKDPGQRDLCGCAVSVDIGSYNNCPHGCAYCYANTGEAAAQKAYEAHDPASPLLCGRLLPGEVVRERKVKSHRPKNGAEAEQLRFA